MGEVITFQENQQLRIMNSVFLNLPWTDFRFTMNIMLLQFILEDKNNKIISGSEEWEKELVVKMTLRSQNFQTCGSKYKQETLGNKPSIIWITALGWENVDVKQQQALALKDLHSRRENKQICNNNGVLLRTHF